jgi:hypothetical protein
MKNSNDKMSDTMSIKHGCASQISTPRLTPLKMLDRNRNQLVSKDDIDSLENKIKELEDQIHNAKKKGEDKPSAPPTVGLLTEKNLLQHIPGPYLHTIN